MEKNAHYFIVGIFVTTALLGMVAFILWLAGTHDVRHYDKYTIYFMDSVSGLNDGASVQYKGVQVGKVKNIRLTEDRNDLIKVDIEVGQGTPVHANTTATLATLGVTGLVFIQLTTPTDDHAPPRRIDGERYAVIKGSGSALTKLLEDVPQINKRILDITDKIDSILTTQNVQAFSAILANTEHMTRDFNGLLSPDNVANASTAFQNLSAASANIEPAIESFDDTAASMKLTAKHVDDIFTRNKANIDRFSDQGLRQLTVAGSEAARTSRSVRELADTLKQNPSALIYKPSYQGVEIRQ
jgi:phospholipid/cholesterol/gamma-HCH transport system substrate-binding protein